MKLTEIYYPDDGSEIHISVPAKYEICEYCHGHGTQDCFDGGFTASEVDDPDFIEDYRSGMYNKPCEECDGQRVILVPDRDNANPQDLELFDKAQEQRWQYDAEVAAERTFFQRAAEGMARW